MKLKYKLYIFIFLLLSVVIGYKYVLTVSYVDAVVTYKEGKSDQYRVYTDKGTFIVEDDVYFFNFNSADLYGRIINNRKYRLKVQGVRIGFLSKFQNIISITELSGG